MNARDALARTLAGLKPKVPPDMGASERAKIGAAWRRGCQRTAQAAAAKALGSGIDDAMREAPGRADEAEQGLDARVLARAKQRARAEVYRAGRALGAGPFKASPFARAVRRAVEAWGEQALEAHGGASAAERALGRVLEARCATAVTLERLLGLATIDARAWRTFDDVGEWVGRHAVEDAPLAITAAGGSACMEWVARERARAVGLEGAPSAAEVVAWTRHWAWPQATPPLGIAALMGGEAPLKTPGQWAAALRLEQTPARVRARLASEGRAGARAFIERAGASEEAHLRAGLDRLAREWITERWLGEAAQETSRLVRTAECAPERVRPSAMATARRARAALAQAAADLLADARARWAREDALPGNGWGGRARLGVRMRANAGSARRTAQVGWLVRLDEPGAVLALCQLRGHAEAKAVRMRTGAWIAIGSARAVHAMEGLGEASIESSARAGVHPEVRAEALKRVFRE